MVCWLCKNNALRWNKVHGFNLHAVSSSDAYPNSYSISYSHFTAINGTDKELASYTNVCWIKFFIPNCHWSKRRCQSQHQSDRPIILILQTFSIKSIIGHRAVNDTSWLAFMKHLGVNGYRLFGLAGLGTYSSLEEVAALSASTAYWGCDMVSPIVHIFN